MANFQSKVNEFMNGMKNDFYNIYSEGKEYYSCVITLHPDMYKKTVREQYKQTIDKILIRLNYLRFASLIVAEITKKGNIHYHLIVLPNEGSYIEEMIDDFRSMKFIGSTYVNNHTITNIISMKRCLDYIFKEFNKTMKIINKNKEIENLIFPANLYKNLHKKNIDLKKNILNYNIDEI